jgi:hypothetical protein
MAIGNQKALAPRQKRIRENVVVIEIHLQFLCTRSGINVAFFRSSHERLDACLSTTLMFVGLSKKELDGVLPAYYEA